LEATREWDAASEQQRIPQALRRRGEGHHQERRYLSGSGPLPRTVITASYGYPSAVLVAAEVGALPEYINRN
jgi:hypothetical protein